MRHRLYPVILCGGVGARLWPASSPATPKQFVKLVGEKTTFQDAAGRVASLPGVQRMVVVAAVAHEAIVRDQLAEIGLDAFLILEPEGRDSGPAMAAAANWLATQDENAIAIFAAADHLLPDRAAYAEAMQFSVDAAAQGLITMLGAQPTEPSQAYGYVKPVGEGRVWRVERFVEKPSGEVARRYLDEGYLWNAGSFVARAATLVGEFSERCPDLQAAITAALAGGQTTADALVLGNAFLSAPKIAFDHAVMEKTDKAAVVPVDFAWSDLGAWDAVWAASPKDADGNVLSKGARAIDAANVLVRADAGVQVAVVGLSDVAVIVEDGKVLVCALSQSQDVKAVAGEAGPRSQ